MAVRKNITSTLAEYGIDTKNEGSVVRAFCPFHNDTGRPNFTVYENTNSWYCWACKEGGDVIAFVAKMDGTTYGQAKSKIEGVGVDLDELQEKIDGVGLGDEPTPINASLNTSVSTIVREFLRAHPVRVSDVLPILKEFDLQTIKPISPDAIHTILVTVQAKLKKLE